MDIHVQGFDRTIRLFEQLEQRMRKSIMRAALRKGAQVIQAEAKRLAPRKTGFLERSIKVRAGRTRDRNQVRMRVTIHGGEYRGDAFYAMFQELGWRSGRRAMGRRKAIQILRRTGRRHLMTMANAARLVERDKERAAQRKQIPGEHYMEYGAEAKTGAAIDAIKSEVQRRVLAEFS